MIQHFYDPRTEYQKTRDGGPQYWLDEATSTWCEALFADVDYYPDVREHYEHNVIQGLMPAGDLTHDEYGYAMSALIKEIYSREGSIEPILATYDAIQDGGDVLLSLLINVPDLDDWYDQFLREYAAGGPYNDFEGVALSLARSGDLLVRVEDDVTEVEYVESYAPRQGRLYRVRFGDGTWGADTGLQVRATATDREPPITIYRRSARGTHLLELATGEGMAVVTRIADMIHADDQIWALVSSRAAGEITTTVTVAGLPDVSNINYWNMHMEFTATWPDDVVTDESLSFSMGTGSFNGTVFSVNWDDTYVDERRAGWFQATFDPLSLDILDWSLQEQRFGTDDDPAFSLTANGGFIARDSYDEPGVLYFDTSPRNAMDDCAILHSQYGQMADWEATFSDDFWVYFYGAK